MNTLHQPGRNSARPFYPSRGGGDSARGDDTARADAAKADAAEADESKHTEFDKMGLREPLLSAVYELGALCTGIEGIG